MKRAPLRKVSAKQEIELAKRRLLKWQIYNEQKCKCFICGRFLKWCECELSHKKSLASGGKTERDNCDVRCRWWLSGCHPNIEHGLNYKYNELPKWGE